jgi:hypothetical protein
MPWTMDVLDKVGATLISDAPFRAARVTWAADGSGAAEIDLRSADIVSSSLRAGAKRVAFRDPGGTRRFQGWLERVDRSGKPSDVQYKASCLGLAAMLERRVVHGNFDKVAVIATTIAWDLIAHAQAQTDGAMGLTLGTVTGVAPARNRWYCDGDMVADRIKELAEFDPGGFTWEIDADGRFNAWVGGRGTDVSGTVTIAPTDTIDWACKENMEGYATYQMVKGDQNEDEPCGAHHVTVSGGTPATYGRREFVEDDDSRDAAELDDRATEALRARVASRIDLRTAWVEGQGPWAFGTRWLGDVVTAALGTEFGGNATVRLVSITANLERHSPGVVFVDHEWEKA